MIDWWLILAGIFIFTLWYIYSGYLILLKLLVSIKGTGRDKKGEPTKVSVLLTVHNEAAIVLERIINILSQDYPHDLLEVIVASDGSTDATNRIVSEIGDPRIRLFVSEAGHGKTATQNAAIKLAAGDVVVFTDAGSRFEADFIRRIASVFADESVGAADGHLLFVAKDSNQIVKSQGYYWRYELALREAESHLGILAVASGACLAVRRELLKDMEASVGEDCIVPLDVVAQGFKVVHVSNAIAYDEMENDAKREFRSRIRMTLRNWQGTWSRGELLNPIKFPGYALALWSHKLLRWLSPFFLISLTLAVLVGALVGSDAMLIAAGFISLFYVLALVGWGAEKFRWNVPFAAAAYSFLLANLGFLVGVSKAILGKKIYKYR